MNARLSTENRRRAPNGDKDFAIISISFLPHFGVNGGCQRIACLTLCPAHSYGAGRRARSGSTVEKHLNDASKKFDEHLRGVAYRNGRGAALFVAGFTAALWPTDLVVFHRMPELQSTINWLRVAVIGIALAIHLIMRTRIGPKHPTLLLGAGGALVMYAIGWGFGEIGGPDRPWIHLAYPALFFSVLAPVRLRRARRARQRAGAGAVLGLPLPHPQYWHDPLTTLSLSFVASLVALVVAVGHLSFRIMRSRSTNRSSSSAPRRSWPTSTRRSRAACASRRATCAA